MLFAAVKTKLDIHAFALSVFIVCQILDGFMTYYGIYGTSLGIDYEANRDLVFYMDLIGVTVALVVYKLISIILGVLIYYHQLFRQSDWFNLFCVVNLWVLTGSMCVIVTLHVLTFFALGHF